eukprot:COSAG01_NODE_7428_length_3213_cov_6.554592_6_plen_60_part_00
MPLPPSLRCREGGDGVGPEAAVQLIRERARNNSNATAAAAAAAAAADDDDTQRPPGYWA